jgi:hypothetical protein
MNTLNLPPLSTQRRHDIAAVERYARRLREAPEVAVGHVHTQEFAALTPRQQDMVFDRLLSGDDEAARRAALGPFAAMRRAVTWYRDIPDLMQPSYVAYLYAGTGLLG